MRHPLLTLKLSVFFGCTSASSSSSSSSSHRTPFCVVSSFCSTPLPATRVRAHQVPSSTAAGCGTGFCFTFHCHFLGELLCCIMLHSLRPELGLHRSPASRHQSNAKAAWLAAQPETRVAEREKGVEKGGKTHEEISTHTHTHTRTHGEETHSYEIYANNELWQGCLAWNVSC